jgi:thymidylate synthase
MNQYLQFLRTIQANGAPCADRTGVGTHKIFGYQMRFNLQDGFPLLTTKKVHTRSIIHELLWFLNGDTNIKYLRDNKVTIWDEWADDQGNLGPVYGKQWRAWQTADGQTIDQIQQVIEQLKTNPHSRRHIVCAWNVGQIEQMALPPCHLLFQFFVSNNKLSCMLTQRSADAFLGVPFNIASYALLTHMVAQQTNLEVGEFIWSGGDCHIYDNHTEQVNLQLSRQPKSLPQLELDNPGNIDQYTIEHIRIKNYISEGTIRAPIAV